MELAAGYYLSLCEDGHIHLVLFDEDGDAYAELVLGADECEIPDFIADLQSLIKPKGH